MDRETAVQSGKLLIPSKDNDYQRNPRYVSSRPYEAPSPGQLGGLKDSSGFDPLRPVPFPTDAAMNRAAPCRADEAPAGVGGLTSARAPGGPLAQGGVIFGSTFFNKKMARCPATSGQIFLDEDLPDRYAVRVAPKPGSGRRTEQCGKWVITAACSNDKDHPVDLVKHSCGRLSCPSCWPDYIKEKAGDTESRFDGYRDAKLQENAALIPGEKKQIAPRHIVFTVSPAHTAAMAARSIKDGYFNESFFLDVIREEYNRALKISGLLGGASFYHDARLIHPETGADGAKAKMLIGREAKEAGIMDDESAAWNLYQYINGRKDWKKYYRFGPHFHTIGYGQLLEISEFEAAMPGWTYHNKGMVKEVGGLAHYLLSHVSVINDRKAVTWFGRLSQKALAKEQEGEIEYEVKTCWTCGAPLVITDSTRLDIIGKELTVKKRYYTWFFQVCGPPCRFREAQYEHGS